MKTSSLAHDLRRLNLVPSQAPISFEPPPPSLAAQTSFAATEELEVEVRFFTRYGRIQREANLSALPLLYIFQASFPDSALPLLRCLAQRFNPGLDLSAVANARLRRLVNLRPQIESTPAEQWVLQFKTRRVRLYQRHEYNILLDPELFAALRPLASEGAIRKLRFADAGFVFGKHKVPHPVQAHLDILLQAGRGLTDRLPQKFSIPASHPAFVEIEVPQLALCNCLAHRRFHSFRYLDSAVNLSASPAFLRRKTSSRYIARMGLKHPKVCAAMRALNKMLRDRD